MAPEAAGRLIYPASHRCVGTIALYGTTASGGFIGTIGLQHLVIPLDPRGKTLPTVIGPTGYPQKSGKLARRWPAPRTSFWRLGSELAMRDEAFAGNRGRIEQTLRRVRSGQLSPSDAASLLLGGTSEETAERLDSLIDRLGAPPLDIAVEWRRQLDSIAATFERSHDLPLPPLELADLSIDRRGRLIWPEKQIAFDGDAAFPRHSESLASLEHLAQRFAPTSGDSPQGDSPREDGPEPSGVTQGDLGNASDPPEIGVLPETSAADAQANLRTDPSKRPARSARILVSGGCLCLFAYLIGTAIFGAPQSGPDITRTDGPQPDGQSLGSSRQERAPTSRVPGRASPEDSADPMESAGRGASEDEPLERLADISGEMIDAEAFGSQKLAGIDLLPGIGSSTHGESASPLWNPLRAVNLEAPIPPADDDDATSTVAGVTDEEDATNLPRESPQQVQTSTVNSIQLPRVNDVEPVLLPVGTVSTLQLDFPSAMAISMAPPTNPRAIRDSKGLTIATIAQTDDRTEFRWADEAKHSSATAMLRHGRLRDENGRTVFLRPAIQAEPWPMRLDRVDVRPSWDLLSPLPPRQSRVAIDIRLPDDVEVGWIEPLEAASVRRGHALAIIAPTDSETVALGLRLDLRGGQRLSCRIRFAGRLDPTMPWQAISRPVMNDWANQVTAQTDLLSREHDRLESFPAATDSVSRARRRDQQEQLETRIESLRQLADRIARLQDLIASVEARATLSIRVWAEWDDAEQTILSMPDPTEPPRVAPPREDEMPGENETAGRS